MKMLVVVRRRSCSRLMIVGVYLERGYRVVAVVQCSLCSAYRVIYGSIGSIRFQRSRRLRVGLEMRATRACLHGHVV